MRITVSGLGLIREWFCRPRAWDNGDYELVWGKPNADADKPQAANVPRHAATALSELS